MSTNSLQVIQKFIQAQEVEDDTFFAKLTLMSFAPGAMPTFGLDMVYDGNNYPLLEDVQSIDEVANYINEMWDENLNRWVYSDSSYIDLASGEEFGEIGEDYSDFDENGIDESFEELHTDIPEKLRTDLELAAEKLVDVLGGIDEIPLEPISENIDEDLNAANSADSIRNNTFNHLKVGDTIYADLDKKRPVLVLKKYEDTKELLIFVESTQGTEMEKKDAVGDGVGRRFRVPLDIPYTDKNGKQKTRYLRYESVRRISYKNIVLDWYYKFGKKYYKARRGLEIKIHEIRKITAELKKNYANVLYNDDYNPDRIKKPDPNYHDNLKIAYDQLNNYIGEEPDEITPANAEVIYSILRSITNNVTTKLNNSNFAPGSFSLIIHKVWKNLISNLVNEHIDKVKEYYDANVDSKTIINNISSLIITYLKTLDKVYINLQADFVRKYYKQGMNKNELLNKIFTATMIFKNHDQHKFYELIIKFSSDAKISAKYYNELKDGIDKELKGELKKSADLKSK